MLFRAETQHTQLCLDPFQILLFWQQEKLISVWKSLSFLPVHWTVLFTCKGESTVPGANLFFYSPFSLYLLDFWGGICLAELALKRSQVFLASSFGPSGVVAAEKGQLFVMQEHSWQRAEEEQEIRGIPFLAILSSGKGSPPPLLPLRHQLCWWVRKDLIMLGEKRFHNVRKMSEVLWQ